MARDGSVFRYDPDYLREQFTGLVIQRALPFNHFDHEQTTRVFQNTMQPRYTHVSHSTLKRDATRLWLAAKQEIIDSFGLGVLAIDAIRESFKTMLKDIFKSSARTRQGYVKIRKDAEKPCLRPNWDVPTRWNSTYPSESAFSTSGRVLSIRRTRLTSASLEMCICLKDHLNAKERKQNKCPLETPLDFEEDVFYNELQRNEAISLSDEEIALDANASSEGTLPSRGPRLQLATLSVVKEAADVSVVSGKESKAECTDYRFPWEQHRQAPQPSRSYTALEIYQKD
nr:zinc finger BED domain-containing protein RICESLEEPER 2 [Tanacetum cinerariifolium]